MVDLCPIQATVSPLCQEARSQQGWIQGEVKVQTMAVMQELVEDSICVYCYLRGLPTPHSTSMLRQRVGQEVPSGINTDGVNHFIWREVLQKSLCESQCEKKECK